MIRAFWHGLMAAILLAPFAPAAAGYPERPIRLIVPFVAGGSIDRVARLLAERIQARVGQPVIVDNRTGATGNIGTQAVVAAPPDGYTLLMQTSALAITPWLSRLPFDVERDLVPVTRIARTPYALVVRTSLPVESFEAFVAYAAAQPMARRYPGTEVEGFQLLFAARGTPPDVVDRIHAEFARVLRDPDVAKQLRGMGFVPVGDDPRPASPRTTPASAS